MSSANGVDNSFYVLVFLKKLDAKLEKGIREFLAIALVSLLAKWYAAVVVGLLHEEPDPIELKEQHVGAERGINSEHVQALLTSVLQWHWEWQEDRRDAWVLGFSQ